MQKLHGKIKTMDLCVPWIKISNFNNNKKKFNNLYVNL